MMRPAPRAAPAGAPTLNGGAKRGGGAAAALPAPLARLHVFVALAAAVVAATALPSARRSCGIVDRTATHCPAGAAAALLLAGWGATAYALAAPAYLLAAALAALPRPPAAAAWLPAAAEAPLFAAALLDAAAWAKTGLHLPDFDQSLALLWASLKGIRGRFLAAVAAALLAGAALSWAAGRLAGGLAAAAARRGAKGGGAGAWPPRPRALRPLGVAAAALLALAAVGSLRARALACGAPPLAEAAAWNSLPIHLAVGAAPECGGTGTSGGGGAAALDARASLAAAQRCAAPPRAGGAPRAARAELAVALDPAVSARPDAAARAPRSAVLIFVDSLPAREFVSTVPAGTKRTSERFRREVSSLFPESRGCRLLDNHFAASSYTSDGLYASLHGFLPFAYAPQDPPWCVPVDALRQAGYETGIFMAGPIGSDYCGAYWTDGGCTKRFETLKVRAGSAPARGGEGPRRARGAAARGGAGGSAKRFETLKVRGHLGGRGARQVDALSSARAHRLGCRGTPRPCGSRCRGAARTLQRRAPGPPPLTVRRARAAPRCLARTPSWWTRRWPGRNHGTPQGRSF